jgi:hypothetical protein
MLELEVYAAGLSDLDKIMELDQSTITMREIRAIFRKLGLGPRFVGAIPPELRPKTKTQPLNI